MNVVQCIVYFNPHGPNAYLGDSPRDFGAWEEGVPAGVSFARLERSNQQVNLAHEDILREQRLMPY